MKKIFIGIVAFALCLGINSCKKEPAPAGNEPAPTEQSSGSTDEVSNATGEATEATSGEAAEATSGEAAEQTSESTGQSSETEKKAEAPSASVTDLLAKAKAEGAKWSVDEWKSAYKELLLTGKPIVVELQNIVDDLVNNPSKANEIKAKAKDLEKKVKELNDEYDNFEDFAKTIANGKKVVEDKAWIEKTKKELGVPDL
ncbi:MAG: hypothetical protein IKQ77_14535 [Prevotella sp.]|nr:hypothetical protein [Prevotella sp.]